MDNLILHNVNSVIECSLFCPHSSFESQLVRLYVSITTQGREMDCLNLYLSRLEIASLPFVSRNWGYVKQPFRKMIQTICMVVHYHLKFFLLPEKVQEFFLNLFSCNMHVLPFLLAESTLRSWCSFQVSLMAIPPSCQGPTLMPTCEYFQLAHFGSIIIARAFWTTRAEASRCFHGCQTVVKSTEVYSEKATRGPFEGVFCVTISNFAPCTLHDTCLHKQKDRLPEFCFQQGSHDPLSFFGYVGCSIDKTCD
jgi:hypothetical protein